MLGAVLGVWLTGAGGGLRRRPLRNVHHRPSIQARKRQQD
jgi:hypothetical protein